MITTRPVQKNRPSAALAARERLLHDPQIRRNKPGCASPTKPSLIEPSISITFSADDAGTSLSRFEQEQQAIAIARTYKQYYLAEIAYNRREIVARLKPLRDSKANTLQITVDTNGNANIEVDSHPVLEQPTLRLSYRRLLFIIGILVAAASITAVAGLY